VSTERADASIAMRVLQTGTNDTGSHQVGDTIVVDAAHAELFEMAGFAERVEGGATVCAQTAARPRYSRLRTNPGRP
jgi:hypothetical protein